MGIPELMEGKLKQWLNETFNEFYTVTDEFDCELHIVQHLPETDNTKFVEMLTRIYPDLKDDGMIRSFIINDNEFCVRGGDHIIWIKPIDDEIHHTELI